MSEHPHILIVEDSTSLAETYRAYLERLKAKVRVAADLAEARRALAESSPDLVLLDVHLPDGDGLSILPELSRARDGPKVIVMTAHGSVSTAVHAMRAGATDFLVKPFDAERLITTAKNALEQVRLSRLVKRYENSFHGEGFGAFIGRSLAMQAVYRMIESAAPSKASVFITGESGTGKELCAIALHQRSKRNDGPFIALNCAAFPKELIESEIFGHRKGAFTGATSDREGAALRANGGTLFLDEICEMDMALQGKLLRFLQTGAVQAVGSDEIRHVDVRILCATNRDPLEEVKAGRFREDLYYRLHVIPIELPPLRERGDDAVELAQTFLGQLAKEEGKSFEGISDNAEHLICTYSWPGNVRELHNVIQTAVVLNDGPMLEKEMLTAVLGKTRFDKKTNGLPRRDVLHMDAQTQAQPIEPLWQVERRTIRRAIKMCNGNISRAAAKLEVAPSTIYRKLQMWEDLEEMGES